MLAISLQSGTISTIPGLGLMATMLQVLSTVQLGMGASFVCSVSADWELHISHDLPLRSSACHGRLPMWG